MSELQLSAVTMGPPDAAHRSMSLPLRSGATDGSASAESLASSSTSPDSMRSLSSLSGGRTDSPLDSDMPEGNTGRKVTTGEDDSGIQSPDCRPDNDNDNSASVYLDADEDGWCETRDDQDNITRVRTHKQGQNDQEHSDVHSNGNHGRRSSDDSSTTEALLCCSGCEEDEDDEEEEDSFLSLSSADVVMRCQNEAEEGQMQSSSRRPNVSPVNEFQVESLQESEEWARTQSSSKRSDVGPVNELHQTALLESVDIPTEQSQLQSSSRRPSVGPVNELQVESLQESKQRAQTQSSSKRSDVGPVNELHQTALVESVEIPTEESQLQSSSRRPSVSHVKKFNQEAPQDAIKIHTEAGQTQSSTRRPNVGHDGELNQEDIQESQLQSSTSRPSVGHVSTLQQDAPLETCRKSDMSSLREPDQEALQESVQLHRDQGEMQSSTRGPTVLQESVESQIQSLSTRPDIGPESELVQETHQEFVEISEEETTRRTEVPLLSSTTPTETPSFTDEKVQAKPTLQNTKDRPGRGHPRPAPKLSLTKSPRTEVKRCPRPDLRNVKPKIVSRAASAPRPANPGQSGAGPEKKPLPTRGRPASKKGQDNDGVLKKTRSSCSQARAAAPAPASPAKPKALPAQTEKRPPPRTTPEEAVRREPEEGSSMEVMGVVEEETECPEGDTAPEEPSSPEIPHDSDQKGSGVKPPKPASGNVCVPTGARAAAPAGAPKTCGPASSSSTCRVPQKPASSKLPVKGAGLPTTLSSSSLGSAASESNTAANNRGVPQVMKSEEKAVRPPSSLQLKPAVSKATVGIRSRANSTPVKPTSSTGQKTPAMTATTAAKPTHNALQRSASARPNRPSGTAVEKGSRGVRSVPGRPHGGGGGGVAHPEEEEEKHLRLQNEKKNQCIAQLRKLVAHGNRRLEALAVVIQHIFTEREEALKQKKDASVQLRNLREELTHSVSCCERLQKEKEEVCVALEAAVLKLQQQHQEELAQLEETLRDFYSAEWDKTHQAYQEEADKYRALMQQQVEELRSKQEALRKEQQVTHAQEMEALRQGYEATLAELRRTHQRDLQELDGTLKQSEASMNEKIENLRAENEAMNAKLREEEERRKALAEKGQKDPHLVYLEQELESLKVVLEIKTSKLHEQDKKIMQMDKLMENNGKLEECLKKLQQENEDYKARMDKHAALSRQLSTEQAVLQQTLQMESKVNKRLSMENEELLWKLHNGDLSSPRRLSPTSPFHSPRNSASFPSAPVSPR